MKMTVLWSTETMTPPTRVPASDYSLMMMMMMMMMMMISWL